MGTCGCVCVCVSMSIHVSASVSKYNSVCGSAWARVGVCRDVRVCGRTFASKKDLAPFTPSVDTSISERSARTCKPLPSASSPAAAFRKISRNWTERRKSLVHLWTPCLSTAAANCSREAGDVGKKKVMENAASSSCTAAMGFHVGPHCLISATPSYVAANNTHHSSSPPR